jgi:hypothetical protein
MTRPTPVVFVEDTGEDLEALVKAVHAARRPRPTEPPEDDEPDKTEQHPEPRR